MIFVHKLLSFFKKTKTIPEAINKTIPTTLDEAVDRLYSELSETAKLSIYNAENMHMYHFSLGMALRNDWIHPINSPLKDYFKNNFGLGHPDDMSAIILDCLQAKIKNTTIDLNASVQYYKDYWLKYHVDPMTQKEIPLK